MYLLMALVLLVRPRGLLRRAHPEVRVDAMRRDHVPLIVAALALAVLPFVLDRVGLPLRTAIDVVVFAVACMGLNILVGYTGLVSFGHGAWFGLGAYAAALSQRYWFPGESSCRRCLRAVRRRRRRCSRRADPAPARRLFLAADAGVDRAALRHRLSLDRVHRRRERARRRHPLRPCSASTWSGDWTYYAAGRRARHGGVLSAAPIPSFARRQRAGRDPRERGARALHRLPDQPLQAHRLRAVGDRRRARRHAVGLQSPLCVGGTAVGGVLGRAHRHGGHRRDEELPGPGARCLVLHSFSRVPVDLDAALVVLVRPSVRRLHRLLAHRPGRRGRGADRAVSQKVVEAAAMAGRTVAEDSSLPQFSAVRPAATRPSLSPMVWSNGSAASTPSTASPHRERSHAARADRTERRRQDHGFQSRLRACSARPRHHRARRPLHRGIQARGHHRGRRRPLVPDHQSVSRPHGEENLRLAVQARHRERFDVWTLDRGARPTSTPRPPS